MYADSRFFYLLWHTFLIGLYTISLKMGLEKAAHLSRAIFLLVKLEVLSTLFTHVRVNSTKLLHMRIPPQPLFRAMVGSTGCRGPGVRVGVVGLGCAHFQPCDLSPAL